MKFQNAWRTTTQPKNKSSKKKQTAVTPETSSHLAPSSPQDPAAEYKQRGDRFMAQRQYRDAFQQYNEALAVRQNALGEQDALVADAYCDMAFCRQAEGQMVVSWKFYNVALALQSELFGEDSLQVAKTYKCIGSLLMEMKRYQDAILHFRMSLEIQEGEGEQGERDILAIAKTNLACGDCYRKLDDYNHASWYLQKALSGFESCEGDKILETAAAYSSLGLVYQMQNQYEMAFQHHELAMIARGAYREGMPVETAASYMNMGLCRKAQFRYEEALELLGEALVVLMDTYGEDHPETAACMVSLGKCYQEQKHVEQAIVYYHRAEAALIHSIGEAAPQLTQVYGKLHQCYLQLEDATKAAGYKKKAVRSCAALKGKKSSSKTSKDASASSSSKPKVRKSGRTMIKRSNSAVAA